MTKSKIIKRISECIEPRRICRVYMNYDEHYFYYFPLKVNEKFFLGAAEDDFILDGWCIRRIKQVEKAQIKNDKCLEISIGEGIVDSIVTPEVDISSWQSIFDSLHRIGKNIIIEHESRDADKCEFYIGRIESVRNHSVLLRYFDADGVWDKTPTKIPYSDITSVTFGSRYVDVFSKYLPEI